MIMNIVIPAGRNEIFTQEAANSMIGHEFNATKEVADGKKVIVGRGKILETKLIHNGSAVEATIEWPDEPSRTETTSATSS